MVWAVLAKRLEYLSVFGFFSVTGTIHFLISHTLKNYAKYQDIRSNSYVSTDELVRLQVRALCWNVAGLSPKTTFYQDQSCPVCVFALILSNS